MEYTIQKLANLAGELAQMYVDDERFTDYYDQNQPGTVAFL